MSESKTQSPVPMSDAPVPSQPASAGPNAGVDGSNSIPKTPSPQRPAWSSQLPEAMLKKRKRFTDDESKKMDQKIKEIGESVAWESGKTNVPMFRERAKLLGVSFTDFMATLRAFKPANLKTRGRPRKELSNHPKTTEEVDPDYTDSDEDDARPGKRQKLEKKAGDATAVDDGKKDAEKIRRALAAKLAHEQVKEMDVTDATSAPATSVKSEPVADPSISGNSADEFAKKYEDLIESRLAQRDSAVESKKKEVERLRQEVAAEIVKAKELAAADAELKAEMKRVEAVRAATAKKEVGWVERKKAQDAEFERALEEVKQLEKQRAEMAEAAERIRAKQEEERANLKKQLSEMMTFPTK